LREKEKANYFRNPLFLFGGNDGFPVFTVVTTGREPPTFRIKTKTCGAKSGLKIGSLNPKTDLWQI
jgi:hypothetical protein